MSECFYSKIDNTTIHNKITINFVDKVNVITYNLFINLYVIFLEGLS